MYVVYILPKIKLSNNNSKKNVNNSYSYLEFPNPYQTFHRTAIAAVPEMKNDKTQMKFKTCNCTINVDICNHSLIQ